MFVESASPCEICTSIHDLQLHHIESRRMGGSKNTEIHAEANKAWLCATCHRNITENRWEFTRTEETLRVVDKETGDIVARRLFRPGFEGSSYLHGLNLVESQLEEMLQGVPYLKDEELAELFQAVRFLGKQAWKLQAAILWEAKQRSVYGDRAWEVFFKDEEGVCNRLQSSLEESTWYVVAAGADNPHFWLGYAEDQKAQNPSYSTADFKAELKAARGLVEDPVENRSGPCPWLRTYCSKLGREVSREDCRVCRLY